MSSVLDEFRREGERLHRELQSCTSDRSRHAIVRACEAHDRRLLVAYQGLGNDAELPEHQRRSFRRYAENIATALCDPSYGEI